jgi:WD40 repeat protein
MLDEGERPIGFTPDGRGLISILDKGAKLRHWSGPQAGEPLPCPWPLNEYVTVFSPASQSLYSRSPGGEVQVLDVNTLECKRSFRTSNPCSMLYHVSPDEHWLTGRSTVRDLYVWDTASGDTVAHFNGFEGNSNSRDLAVFSPDSRVLGFVTRDWEVKLCDTAERQIVRTLGPHPWRVYAISFSSDSRHVASSSWEGDVRIHEVATGRELAALYGHGSGVHGHGFSPDGATLVSGGDDSSVRFWNIATGREMLVFEQAYNQTARLPFLSPTGDLLVWQDFSQNLRVRVQAIPTMAEIEAAHRAESGPPPSPAGTARNETAP